MILASNLSLEGGAVILTWDFLAANWSTAPAVVGTVAAGDAYAYTLGGVLAPAVAGLMLDLSPRWGLAAALAVVALVGFWRPSVARG